MVSSFKTRVGKKLLTTIITSMNTSKYFRLLVAVILVIASCKKAERFAANSDDGNPPGTVTKINYKPLFGGARLYFTAPGDEDLLSIEAVYKNAKGKAFTFAVSYFADSLDVYGLADTTGT